MLMTFVGWLLGLIFNPEKDWRLEDREMGHVPSDWIEDDEND